MAGRPRKPTNLKILQGTARPDRINPNEPKPAKPIGKKAPAYFDAELEKIWKEFVSNAPEGVLGNCDAFLVEAACLQLQKLRKGEFTAADLAQLRGCLSAMGMTPADRAKLDIPIPKKPSVWDDF